MLIRLINSEKLVCPKKDQEIKLIQCKACSKHGSIQGLYRGVICKYFSFENAPVVQDIARDLIPEHHFHLVEANIQYLFRNGTWYVNRKARAGNAEKCSGKVKHLTGHDFIITINAEIWPRLTDKAKVALVDHELCHCIRNGDDEDGNPIWATEPHTVEDFAAVIRRHGLWDEELKRIGQAMDDFQKQQMVIFDSQEDHEQPLVANAN